MAHILKNNNLEIHIDLPFENYKFSRFDWTGKIVEVKFQNRQVSSGESPENQNDPCLGKGFYNEFGFDTPLGYDEAAVGGWFHKIGVGLLKKTDTPYRFSKTYEIKPAEFEIIPETNKLTISCQSEAVNGYSYLLRKEIALHNSGFTITYFLENTGEKEIVTNEYVHNFTLLNNDPIGSNYRLQFPFLIKPELFEETVNPEQKVDIGLNEINFNGSPKEQFFFSNLTGDENVDAGWELTNLENNIGISETGSFKTNKVNVWGWKHVISPELYVELSIQPGKSMKWSRNYEVYKVNGKL